MEIESALSIHPDALPCLKRQQLENLCIRLGVKSTGKKSELIARLEGFATGQTIARSESASSMCQDSKEDDKENGDQDDVWDVPQSNSIRVISKPRESHFASATALHDEELEEVGMVLPSSGSHGSLRSLRRNRTVLDQVQGNPAVAPPVEPTEGDSIKRSASTRSNLYPWKKLLTSASSFRSISSSSGTSVAVAPSAKLTEMGLGLHASESQSSISSTMRKWLKGEGPSTVSAAEGQTERRMTRSASVASTSGMAMKVDPDDGDKSAMSPRPKRKRSQESLAEELEQTVGSPIEQAQRRIKPRPSRVARASIADEGQPNAIVQERILAEVRARMAAAKKQNEESCTSPNDAATTPNLPASPLKSVASRTRGRFSTQHEKNFDRMDSIANHYAAVRPPPSAKEEGTSAKRARIASTESSASPSVRIAEPSAASNVQRTEEEREAVRRKLELARHRRRSSTAAGRKSMAGGGAKRAHVASTPGSKLTRQGFASKISGAVRGFMGAARGLTATTSEKHAAVNMGPPKVQAATKATPQLTQVAKVQSDQSKKPALASSASENRKKRSTFDLQASLARKPVGYVPYSAKETVGLLQSGNVSPSKSSNDRSRSSSITFPSSTAPRKASASRSPETSRTGDTANSTCSPASSSTPARHVNGRKTRSSTSTAARTPIRSPRKSQTGSAAVERRRRQPSLQVAGQTMASTMIRQRRMRTYAIHQKDQGPSSPDLKPTYAAPHSTSVSVAGHGSPSKQSNVVRIDGRGRGQSSLASERGHLTSINV